MMICTECNGIGGYHQNWCSKWPKERGFQMTTPVADTEPSAYDVFEAQWADVAEDMRPENPYAGSSAPLTFTLTITLGNAGMQTGADVADVLRIAADSVGSFYADTVVRSGYDGRFRDLNGNTVGSWGVK